MLNRASSIRVRQRDQIDGSGVLVRVETGEAAGTRWNMRAQSLVVGNDQLLLRFVIGDGGREIAGRNVADDRMRIASLKVDDGDGIGLAQRDISLPVLGHGDAIRSGAEDTTGDRNAEIDGAHHLIGIAGR